MKKSLLLAILFGSIQTISVPSAMAAVKNQSSSSHVVNSFPYGKTKQLTYFLLEGFNCVPPMVVVYDTSISGDYTAAYSAALDYMLAYNDGC